MVPTDKQKLSNERDYVAVIDKNEIIIYQATTREKVWQLSGHTGDVLCLAFDHTGTKLVSGSEDKIVKYWDLQTGKLLKDFTEHTEEILTVAFSPDGQYIASGGEDSMVRIWNVNKSKSVQKFSCDDKTVNCVLFGQRAERLFIGTEDGMIQSWDIKKNKLLEFVRAHKSAIKGMKISSDNQYLASYDGRDKLIKIWYPTTLELGYPKILHHEHLDIISDIDISSNGENLVSVDRKNSIFVWSIKTEWSTPRIKGDNIDEINFIRFSKNGSHFITGNTNGTLKLWETESRKLVKVIDNIGELIADTTANVPDVVFKNAEIVPIDFHLSKQLRPYMGFVCDDTIKLFCVKADLITEESVPHLWHGSPIKSMAFNNKGTHVASGGYDNVIRLWDLYTRKEVKVFANHNSPANCLVFNSADSILVSGHEDGKIFIHDIAKGICIKEINCHSQPVTRIAFTFGEGLVSMSRDGKIELSSALVIDKKSTPILAPCNDHYALAVSTKGRCMAVTDIKNNIIIYTIHNSKDTLKLEGHSGLITCLAFSPDGTMLVSGSFDCSIRVWDLRSGKCINTYNEHKSPLRYVNFNELGSVVVSACSSMVHVWNLDLNASRKFDGLNDRFTYDFTASAIQELSSDKVDNWHKKSLDCKIKLEPKKENTIKSLYEKFEKYEYFSELEHQLDLLNKSKMQDSSEIRSNSKNLTFSNKNKVKSSNREENNSRYCLFNLF